MDILTLPLDSFSFDKVVAFAKEKNSEGIQLDYKEELPDKTKLAQLVAAFANTRGGVIVVGIKENRKTGEPVQWKGIDDARHEEYIAQVIGNITPIPKFELHKTNESDDKVFLIVRIDEGTETPYYSHNDSNLWIRTGSVKKSVDVSSPEYAELLFKKREKAKIIRDRNIILANENYLLFLKGAELERKRRLPNESSLQKVSVGSNSSTLTIVVQPFFPKEQLVRPLDIEPIIEQAEVTTSGYSFPRRATMWDSVQEGMLQFNWENYGQQVDCQQVFANGLNYTSDDVLRITEEEGKYSHLAWFISQLYVTLKGSNKLYKSMGYQGSIIGFIKVVNFDGVRTIPAFGSGFRDEERTSLFSEKSWKIEIDTTILSNESKLRSFVAEIGRDIHWAFGYKNYQKAITVERLEEKGFFK